MGQSPAAINEKDAARPSPMKWPQVVENSRTSRIGREQRAVVADKGPWSMTKTFNVNKKTLVTMKTALVVKEM